MVVLLRANEDKLLLKQLGLGEGRFRDRQGDDRRIELAVVQFLTWMGLFCMWIFFSVAVARDILGASDPQSDLYKTGIYLANDCFATYNFVALVTAILFLWLGRFVSAKWIHVVSLACGGLGLASVGVVKDPTILTWVCFSGVGIAWASILSMPYAMLAGALPESRIGVYMGIFNLFIVIPQILVAIVLSRVLANFEEVSRLHVVVFGGVCLLLATLATAMIPMKNQPSESTPAGI